MEICADCGKPIGMGEGSYYKKAGDNSDIGQPFHSACGDPFGLKAKDAEIARLHLALQRYGMHTWECAFSDSEGKAPCDCGWQQQQDESHGMAPDNDLNAAEITAEHPNQ